MADGKEVLTLSGGGTNLHCYLRSYNGFLLSFGLERSEDGKSGYHIFGISKI